ncbi:NAD(P)/FAD-dependent oxidoreductase [Desertimonas flava]|uniref:NAD(P)/FAD-dependent oxidoreductase n=1 Tax=Desertimonas flava TaxID=2064846 RepID=UPI001968AE9D|nr:FAD-dependent oxidoreductase [Desertimonas flava]
MTASGIDRLERVVVVGGSLAGLRACEALRAGGFTGTVVLVGAEQHQPYDRPPLSKKFLAGEWGAERIALRQPDAFESLGLETLLGVPASGIDTTARSVVLADGRDVPYDGAILATGSQPKRLPDTDGNPFVHVLRSLDDAIALRAVIERPGVRVVVIGAGFIGLEVAATARRAGAEVVVLEGAAAPLIRGVGAELGADLASFHGDEGVDLRTSVAVAGVAHDAAGAIVRMGDGSELRADAVVVGIGVSPATGWLADSGLELRDGIVTAPTLATGAPGVFAAGDVVRWTHPLFAEEVRIEHWTNAAEQGALAAANLLASAAGGELTESATVPFVWSDQYDHRIQFLGRSTAVDGSPAEWTVLVGSPGERSFVAGYHADGVLRGVLGLNLPRLVMKYRPLIAARAPLADALALADEQRLAESARRAG